MSLTTLCERNIRRGMNTSQGGPVLDYEGFGSCLSPTRRLPDHCLAEDHDAVRVAGVRRTVMVVMRDSHGVGYEWCRRFLARGDNVIAAVADPIGDEALKEIVLSHRENGSSGFKYNTIEPCPIPSEGATANSYGPIDFLILTSNRIPKNMAPDDLFATIEEMVYIPMRIAATVHQNLVDGSQINGRRVMVYSIPELAHTIGTDDQNLRLAATTQKMSWEMHALSHPELSFVMLQPSLEPEGGKLSVPKSVEAALTMLDRVGPEMSGRVIAL
eukprot:TRINITY_DN6152_c0_g1_i1.p1 TRINITY_DN6152_c0_g1~~TRINITY_DN6152_c0_g1_i1.p1  ORF type:complete len:272 (-),score=49.13 TRINITY_DN6152_c0_g1_i1:80-895(-)